jgi:regulator of cell morphogenesis and NO signaling
VTLVTAALQFRFDNWLIAEGIMNFNTETKVKDIALAEPKARRVFEDAGVDYCCGGGNSLADACLEAGARPEEILKRLREASGEAGPADANWVSAPLGELTRHIREKHHRYVREAIARLRPLASKVKAKHGENHGELAEVEQLFLEVAGEMSRHMQKEELILFPYIEVMERAASGGAPLEPPFFQTVRNPIHMMMKEHDAAGELVKRIRMASAQYTPPAEACESYRALYQELREFEADLHEHVHLENNILFPRAVELEAAAAERAES